MEALTMPAGSTRERFITDELVVAIPHQDLVLGELAELSDLIVNAGIDKSDPRLGLSLISVVHAQRAYGDDEGAALNLVLRTIRERCAERYDNWVPTIGKNRLLERIDGAGYIGGGGVDGTGYIGGGAVDGAGYIGGGGGGVPTPCDAADLPESQAGERGRDVKVAILDTRLYPHPDLAGRFYTKDQDALLRQSDKLPYHSGHATFLAGLITQRAPLVELEIHNVLSDERAAATAWDVATRIARFAGSDVGVLNLSLGCYTDDGAAPLLLARAVELLTPGVVIVAAAGNHGSGKSPSGRLTARTPFWPAALDDVVAVGAHDADGERAAFSPVAPWITLSAPGVDVKSTYLAGEVLVPGADGETVERAFGGYASWSGTSFAAATVSGELAARTGASVRSPREALDHLLGQSAAQAGTDIWAYDQRAG
jgi:membrane-anchored mycosin MYCP